MHCRATPLFKVNPLNRRNSFSVIPESMHPREYRSVEKVAGVEIHFRTVVTYHEVLDGGFRSHLFRDENYGNSNDAAKAEGYTDMYSAEVLLTNQGPGNGKASLKLCSMVPVADT